jgi:ArsR family transcriptional regulator
MKSNSIEICSEQAINHQKVNKVKSVLPAENEIDHLTELFKILGDKTRLKIVLALANEELCVCDLAWLIQLSVSAVSHQLRVLRNLKLVKFRKSGKMVYYSLDDDHTNQLIEMALVHSRE